MIIPASGNSNSIEIIPQTAIGNASDRQNGWISVKDSLPIRDADVLFQSISGRMFVGQYQGDKTGNSVAFRVWNDREQEYVPVICVAWQPLPALYEGD